MRGEATYLLLLNIKIETMKIYLLTQNENTGYDTYDSCVVCAESPEDAVTITPGYNIFGKPWSSWASSKDNVKCQEIGEANEGQIRGVILSSFNAG